MAVHCQPGKEVYSSGCSVRSLSSKQPKSLIPILHRYKRPAPVEVELVADETLTVNVHNDKITIEEPPKTGDNSNMGLWFGLLMLSCLGMVGTVIYGRRRRRKDAEV